MSAKVLVTVQDLSTNVSVNDEIVVLELADIGPQGPEGPEAQVSIGTTTTTEPGGNANVTATNNVLDFEIPRGFAGPGGANSHYLVLSDDTTQTNDFTVNKMVFGNRVEGDPSLTVVNGTEIHTDVGLVVNLQFSVVLSKTDGGADDIDIWFAKNGENIPDSNTKFTIATNHYNYVAAWNYVLTLHAGDYLEVLWHSNDATMSLKATPAETNPDIPAMPSIILTISQEMYTQITDEAIASADAAAASAAAALLSQQAAAASELNAGISETNAAISESNALGAASDALASEQAAALSEQNAVASEQNAGIYASEAEASATAALGSEQAAAASADAALASEQAASSSADNAAIQAGLSSDSADAALASQQAAALSEAAAAQSAIDADLSAQAAAGSESAVAADAQSAHDSQVAAALSEGNALASANAAAASYDSFDDRYLGAKNSDPSTDNDGNALLTGAIYWNTMRNIMRVWNASTWVDYVVRMESSDTPPANPEAGVMWYCTLNGRTYIYYDSTWVEVGTSSPVGQSATVTIGTVNTVAYGVPATVTNTGTDRDVVLNFEIPAGASAAARRHDYVSAGYGTSYLGVAPAGASETAYVWKITRLVYNSDGSSTKAIAYNARWSDHLTISY